MGSSEDRVTTLLLKQTRKVIYFCDAGNMATSMAVHEIRKSIKRIRAWLQFFEHLAILDSFLDKSQNLKTIASKLSTTRESFVNLSLIDKYFSGKHFLPEKKIKLIGEIIAEENHRQVELLFEEHNYFGQIRKDVQEFENQIRSLSGVVTDEIVVNHLVENYIEVFSIYEQIDWKNYSSTYLHRLRKKLKQMWFQYEVVKNKSPRYFADKIRQLNDITEMLGNDHDNYIFSEYIHQHCFQCFSEDEIQIFNNLIEHQRELTLTQLPLRLKQFFNESCNDFEKRLTKLQKKKSSVKTMH